MFLGSESVSLLMERIQGEVAVERKTVSYLNKKRDE